ncbi:unnamed protein product [Adineta steineri]|uniref:EF-hand domain-containing protein n=1 Tax=Adineta steineri TaxID=433720 RepID=A0A815FBL6_9BILA|nr:unnamed protein product [Adineta steineri]CAF1323083.1 unnamed protein product [Adineta steineri]CAF3667900.1 unnamed protein product [Adineta steineri]CAF3693666.1 unnamed protein product [Adineta steineri]
MGNKASGKGKKNSITLSAEDLNILKANTHYTEEEILAWHSGFLKDCPMGKLDKKQFLAVYRRFYPEGKADTYCNFVFKAFDTDNNNWIDFTEFLLAVGVSQHGNLEEKLKMAFDIYDQNKDGQINRKDMIQIIEAMYDLANEEDRTGEKSPDKRVDLIMQRLNKDKDGLIILSLFFSIIQLFLICIDIVIRDEFIQGCLRDELLRKILAPNTAIASENSETNATTLNEENEHI